MRIGTARGLRGALVVATSLLAATVVAGCDGGAGRGAQGDAASTSAGPAESSQPDDAGPLPRLDPPSAVDRRAWCRDVGPRTVADLVGTPVTRERTTRLGDMLARGVTAPYFRCEFGTELDGADPSRGLALTFVPHSAGTAGDGRRALEAEPSLADAACTFDDVPGVDTERGYVQACEGIDAAANAGVYVAAGTAVRVDVGAGHLYCQEFSSPINPSGVRPADVVAACADLFTQVAR